MENAILIAAAVGAIAYVYKRAIFGVVANIVAPLRRSWRNTTLDVARAYAPKYVGSIISCVDLQDGLNVSSEVLSYCIKNPCEDYAGIFAAAKSTHIMLIYLQDDEIKYSILEMLKDSPHCCMTEYPELLGEFFEPTSLFGISLYSNAPDELTDVSDIELAKEAEIFEDNPDLLVE